MENRKFIKLLIPVLILGFFVVNNSVFAYDTETHAYLTGEIVKFYNKNFPNNKISDDLASYLLDGSRREDDIPRWMNHFYDPVYNRGLTHDSAIDPLINIGTWQKSKDWAQDNNNQNSLTYKVPATIASILTAIQEQKISAISTETDFTWQEAIRSYVKGEKEKAMFMLGHILHLIEDASVPDHTRNDPHLGDSPYENYTQQFTLSNPDINLNKELLNRSPIILSDLNPYFDELANYSNNNFYSRDTIGIQSGYKKPEPEYFEILNDGRSYGIYEDKEFGNYPIVKAKGLVEVEGDELLNRPLIMSSYWFRLSTKSVQYGAGVINLFFQEAEKAKNDPNFAKTEEKSIFAKAFETTKNLFAQIGNFFSGIGGVDQNFQPAGQVGLQETNPIELNTAPQNEINQIQSQQKSQKISNQQTNQLLQSIEATKIKPEQVKQTGQEEEQEIQPDQQLTEQQTETPEQTQQLSNFKECTFTTVQSPSHQKIIINEVAWMGTANSANDEWIELKNISGSEVDISSWQLIDKGEQIKINLASINGSKVIRPGQFILLERTDDNSVPGITADFIYAGALSNTSEGLRLFDEQCNLIDEVLVNPDWPAGDNTAKKTMERDISGLGWHTSSVVGGTPKAANTQQTVINYSGGGGVSESTTNQQQTAKILISEIQIAGVTNNDEFIELYNSNSQAVDLTNWLIKRKSSSGTEYSLVASTRLEGKIIPAYGYFLIANEEGYSGSITPDVLWAKSNTIAKDNTIILYNVNQNIIDKVGFGLAADCESNCALNSESNQSIQRKFQNNTFVDTDNNASDFEIQTCPSPKAPSKTCQQANQAPSAFFVYSPASPTAGDLISFNAASSSDPDGQITSYQWDFGDNATSSVITTTTTHTYSQASEYQVSLIVFDNQNVFSTVTSTIISVSVSGTNHLVISEIYPDKTGNNFDFVELYNPTNSSIALGDYSLKILKGGATSTTSLANFSTSHTIAAKSFFLVGLHNYSQSTSTLADVSHSSYSLPTTETATIILYNNSNSIDEFNYNPANLAVNQSLERKAFSNSQCATTSGSGEFLGNGCDTDNESDFEIRATPNPQNSLSFSEPRNAPTTPQNFSVQYSSSTMELVFDWSSSQDYSGTTSTITYKITDISTASSTLPTIETASTTAKISINEIGRNYQFYVQAFDKEGLGSATSTSSITVPSFLSGLYFYQNTKNTAENLIEAYYNQYPFVPDLFGQNKWRLLVFYLNSDAKNDLNNNFWQPNDLTNVLAIRYNQCAGGSGGNSLILPDTANYCKTDGGAYNTAFDFNKLEDNHFIIQAASSSQELNLINQNYLSIAFYSTYSTQTTDGRIPFFQLVAVDKTRYYFGQIPNRQAPQISGQINLNDKISSKLYLDWPKATDPDTLDYLLNYEIQYNPSEDWISVGNATGTSRFVAPGDNFSINVRVKDDFDNYSSSTLTANWSYPPITFYITQNIAGNWSEVFGKDYNNSGYSDVNLQSIVSEDYLYFNRVVLKIKRVTDGGQGANLKLSVFANKNNEGQDRPDFNNRISSSIISDIGGNPENKDLVFGFSDIISFDTGIKYWFVLEVDNYTSNPYVAWGANSWQNAVSNNNPYLNGETGRGVVQYSNHTYTESFSVNPAADWYMKIGLQ